MACGSGSVRCPGGAGFVLCDTDHLCHWLGLETDGHDAAIDPPFTSPFNGLPAGLKLGALQAVYVLAAQGLLVEGPLSQVGDYVSFVPTGSGFVVDARPAGGDVQHYTPGEFLVEADIYTANIATILNCDAATYEYEFDNIEGDATIYNHTLHAGGVFTIWDRGGPLGGGRKIFEVREDGSVHIRAGTAIVADL